MKTISQIKSEMLQNVELALNPNLTLRGYNTLANRNNYLKSVLLYLETNPNESFVRSEVERLKKLISSKEAQYVKWSKDVCPKEIEVKKRKALFNRELGITVLKRHLKNNLFILQ